MLCVLLVALALWCVGSGMNGPIAAHAAAMEAGQGASHHDPMAHKLHEGGDTHSVAAHVHATCTAMAGHYIEATGHFSCETPSADCSRISFGRLDGPDPNGLSPEATTPPPRA